MKLLQLFMLVAVLSLAACESGGGEGTTANGFSYIHHVKNGGTTPQVGEYAYFQAKMRNGEEVTLDSRTNPTMPRVIIPDPTDLSKGRPSAVVEALVLMSVGDSLTVFQNIEEGTTPPPGYEVGGKIAFDLVLMEIKTEEQYQAEINKERAAGQAQASEIKANVDEMVSKFQEGTLEMQTSDTGLRYVINEQGSGKPAEQGKRVSVNYYGVLTNGNEFDNSFKRGRPFDFNLGQGAVIKGWDEGIGYFNEGGNGFLIVPAELGYGAVDKGNIPPNSELIFYVELLKVG